jgi:hypothetical protein
MLNSQGNSNAQAITTRQKLAVAFLLSFTFLMIGLAVYSMKSNLQESLAYGGEQNKIADVEGTATTSDDYLKERDTDKDGISDYEELKTYGTSAFLPDTDGDGVGDADELKNGTDPNCPEGQNCSNQSGLFNANSGTGASSSEVMASGQQPVFTDEQLKQMQQVGQLTDIKNQIDVLSQSTGSSSLGRSSSTAGADLMNSISGVEAAGQGAAAGLGVADKAQAQAILKGGASAANLREALIKAGLTREQLDQISDDDLLKNYQAMLNKQTQ